MHPKLQKRCASYDGVSVVQVYDARPVISQLRADLYNRVIADGKFLECWKLTRIHLIPKVVNSHSLSEFQPIALQPVFAKIFGKIAFRELARYFETKGK